MSQASKENDIPLSSALRPGSLPYSSWNRMPHTTVPIMKCATHPTMGEAGIPIFACAISVSMAIGFNSGIKPMAPFISISSDSATVATNPATIERT
ncbi:hypothetical protein G6F22_012466 [Rhizopus arrhizus]|nr:hypothetical protein G6F22_012466 [Rhizopus arrhizus]